MTRIPEETAAMDLGKLESRYQPKPFDSACWFGSEYSVKDAKEDCLALVAEVRRLRAAAADALEREAGMGWQPIETAPKDGHNILAWCPNNQCHYTVASRGKGFQFFGSWLECTHNLTHWQPLPDPPPPQPPPQSGGGR